jgi:hypothetical protein
MTPTKKLQLEAIIELLPPDDPVLDAMRALAERRMCEQSDAEPRRTARPRATHRAVA